jgi:antitoxin CptB
MSEMESTTDALAVRRKRLMFRSWHRGMKEVDLILGRFAERYLQDFDSSQLDRYELLLEARDGDLYAWYAGTGEPPEELRTDVWQLLKAFKVHEAQG